MESSGSPDVDESLKAYTATPIIVEITFSMLLSAEMKLPKYLFTSFSSFPLTVVFLEVCVFCFMSLVLFGCNVGPTIPAVLFTFYICSLIYFREWERRPMSTKSIFYLPVSLHNNYQCSFLFPSLAGNYRDLALIYDELFREVPWFFN